MGRHTAIISFAIITVSLLLLTATESEANPYPPPGALMVHTDDSITWTFTDPDYCDDYTLADLDCMWLNTQSNVDGRFIGAIVWLLLTFHSESTPGVTAIYFGIEHNILPGYIATHGICGPEGSLEIPDPGWPDEWENAGNSVAFGSPITGQRLFPFYWFAVYGVAGDYLGTGANPAGGYAGYVTDDEPGVLAHVVSFGQVHWFEPGFNDCPYDPLMAVEDPAPGEESLSWGASAQDSDSTRGGGSAEWYAT
jgi:hypothetical protein